MLGEDTTGRSLWDIEDDELAAAVERFAGDLEQRGDWIALEGPGSPSNEAMSTRPARRRAADRLVRRAPLGGRSDDC